MTACGRRCARLQWWLLLSELWLQMGRFQYLFRASKQKCLLHRELRMKYPSKLNGLLWTTPGPLHRWPESGWRQAWKHRWHFVWSTFERERAYRVQAQVRGLFSGWELRQSLKRSIQISGELQWCQFLRLLGSFEQDRLGLVWILKCLFRLLRKGC